MLDRLRHLSWFHVTRSIALVLVLYSLAIEDNAATKSTMITGAISILAVEPVARREKIAPKD